MKLYQLLFFDVRWRLSNRPWVFSNALGPPCHNGYPDHLLSPLWRSMAYYGNEQVLDLTYAVTTGIGRERYTEEQLEQAELAIDQRRLSPFLFPDRTHQIDLRMQAEATGAHPSSYHLGRRRGFRSIRQ